MKDPQGIIFVLLRLFENHFFVPLILILHSFSSSKDEKTRGLPKDVLKQKNAFFNVQCFVITGLSYKLKIHEYYWKITY